MREKYIDEYLDYPLFEFGKSPNGSVDVASPSDDTLLDRVSKKDTDKIMAYVDKMMNVIYKLNEKYPEQVSDIVGELKYGAEVPTENQDISTAQDIIVNALHLAHMDGQLSSGCLPICVNSTRGDARQRSVHLIAKLHAQLPDPKIEGALDEIGSIQSHTSSPNYRLRDFKGWWVAERMKDIRELLTGGK